MAQHQALLIAGPTASGKSAVALACAKKYNGVVVNADSMQVYADLRILSARPDAEELAQAPHALYAMIDGAREYNVGDYIRDVGALLGQLKSEGRMPIFVGGTGLYFKALTEGLVEAPEVPEDLRARLLARAASGEDMHAALAREDPEAASRLMAADLPRILRALGVVLASGRSLASWQGERQPPPLLPPGSWRGIVLDPPREIVRARIDARFLAMMEAGGLEEVRRLAARGLPQNRGVMKAHGVPHLIAHLQGALSLEEAVARGQGDTRRYAKRQITWARKFMADWFWASDAEAASGFVDEILHLGQ